MRRTGAVFKLQSAVPALPFRPPIRMIPWVAGRGEGRRESAQADHKLVFGALDIGRVFGIYNDPRARLDMRRDHDPHIVFDD